MDATLVIESIPMTDYLEIIAPDVVRVKGHRIGLEHIIERYHLGLSPEQMALDFPGVDLVAIYNIIAYYLHHQDTVDAYMARVDARTETAYQAWLSQPPSPPTLRIRAIKSQRERASS
ncbi:DUF433 domain-containing protein [Candidatus Chloroploca sp. Khr17]|uniref:DUF433 domain-containing protein n=1 Tax=Candidatus Chloroploca sp. Khr17 TaxID=2496869 RepID=UPI00101B6145|nr:DUF433 domain-containing protein [Candidatus Chloroploca sp. Khr17]